MKLKWVSETIGDSYKKWKKGDVITIKAQTGTGKTYFIKKVLIPQLEDFECLLLICNRTNLKRQIKLDLLKDANEKTVKMILNSFSVDSIEKLTNEMLDKIEQIDNVTIRSYHQLQAMYLSNMYGTGDFKYSLDFYDYIVCDECHYIVSDSSFNNKTRLIFDNLVNKHHPSSVMIFISATMDNIIGNPSRILPEGYSQHHPYSTGVDYSYVNVKYINDTTSNIVNLVRNDKTDEKWLIFVTSHEAAKRVQNELGEDVATIIKAGSQNEELKSIIHDSKFNCKVLIATKVLDNGVNFDDDLLKNIIIQAWDEVTFIQMLGRKRIDIDNAQQINLYIPVKSKKSFTTLKMQYKKKLEIVKLWMDNRDQFNKKYDTDYNKLPNELFYKHNGTGEWRLNNMANIALLMCDGFADKMIDRFGTKGRNANKWAFVQEQLSWMEKEFNECDYIEEVESIDEVIDLEKYLNSVVGEVMLTKEDRTELIERVGSVDATHSNFSKGIIKYHQHIDTLNSVIKKEKGLPFEIVELKKITRTIDGKKKQFKSPWQVVKLVTK